MAVELRGAGDLGDIPVRKVFGGFRHDVVEHLHILRMHGDLVPCGGAGIRVPQAEIAGINAADDLTDELCAGGGGKVDGSDGIPQAVDAVGDLDLTAQLADHIRHCRNGGGAHLGQVGKAEFVGEHHAVHAAFLQGTEIVAGKLDDLVHAAGFVIIRVAGHGLQVAHCDDGFFNAEKFFHPVHVVYPFVCIFPSVIIKPF